MQKSINETAYLVSVFAGRPEPQADKLSHSEPIVDEKKRTLAQPKDSKRRKIEPVHPWAEALLPTLRNPSIHFGDMEKLTNLLHFSQPHAFARCHLRELASLYENSRTVQPLLDGARLFLQKKTEMMKDCVRLEESAQLVARPAITGATTEAERTVASIFKARHELAKSAVDQRNIKMGELLPQISQEIRALYSSCSLDSLVRTPRSNKVSVGFVQLRTPESEQGLAQLVEEDEVNLELESKYRLLALLYSSISALTDGFAS